MFISEQLDIPERFLPDSEELIVPEGSIEMAAGSELEQLIDKTGGSLEIATQLFQKRYISDVIGLVGGDMPFVAEVLNIDKSTLYRKCKALGIEIGE